MRIWSIHPKYLDQKGLVALWRETLLAQAVLSNKTKGYKNHSQLQRFKEQLNPVEFVAKYLLGVHTEASLRGYKFDSSKIQNFHCLDKIPVTEGQVKFELEHLKKKLQVRDPKLLEQLPLQVTQDILHPSFVLIEGPIASWEKL